MFRRKKDSEASEKFTEQVDDIISMVQYAKSQHEKLIEINKLLQTTIITAGGYLWHKDSCGRYLYCDPSWCEVFFRLEHNCDIVGSTDAELLAEVRERGIRHTYGEVCTGTDEHCVATREISHYIELGWIEDSIFALDVVKTPIFSCDGELKGTVGFAKNLSGEVTKVCRELTETLSAGGAEVVFKNGNSSAAYYILQDTEPRTSCACLDTFPG